MTTLDDLLAMVTKTPENLENLRSYAEYLRTFRDFRQDSGNILAAIADLVEDEINPPAATARALVGVHGRNDYDFYPPDYQAIVESKSQIVKMMSQTRPGVFEHLKKLGVSLLVTRLYDDRFGVGHHPSPAEFAAKAVQTMDNLRPYCTYFEIHNEPNHSAGYEGWGDTDADARDFSAWFSEVYVRLKAACGWAQLGFPGLAIPHRDIEWMQICKPAVLRADWLGVHCYWQNPTPQDRNHLSGAWGLRCDQYHHLYPRQRQIITEAGNSNHQNHLPHDDRKIAIEIVEHAAAIQDRDYIDGVAYFLLSSQDREWWPFAWRTEDGQMKPVVAAIRGLLG